MVYTLDDLLDERNRQLYGDLAAQIPIELHASDDQYWGETTVDGRATILCAPSVYPKSCFTHELLHVRFNLRGMARPGAVVEAASDAERVENEEFVRSLLPYAYNQLIHHKMFPEFIERGFPAHEFLHEADHAATRSASEDVARLRELRKSFPHGIPVRLYILPYLLARSPHDSSTEAQRILKDIRNLSDGSYYSVNELVNKLRSDPVPNISWYLARLFLLCEMSDVGIGPDEQHLVWARDTVRDIPPKPGHQADT